MASLNTDWWLCKRDVLTFAWKYYADMLTQACSDGLIGWEAHNMGHMDRQQGPDHPTQVILGHERGLCTIWKLRWWVTYQTTWLWHIEQLAVVLLATLLQLVGEWTTCVQSMTSIIVTQQVQPKLYESSSDMRAFCLPVAFWMTKQLLLGQETWRCEYHRIMYQFLVSASWSTFLTLHYVLLHIPNRILKYYCFKIWAFTGN